QQELGGLYGIAGNKLCSAGKIGACPVEHRASPLQPFIRHGGKPVFSQRRGRDIGVFGPDKRLDLAGPTCEDRKCAPRAEISPG
ncbi:MAG: hypothetical protein WBE38_18620, partial [Terracidiphilus sp.]